ncbi:MAG: hypothetical protein ISS79_02080 [Phycisphaerae bacterium]|nr:hypothetical protein [Phycisphaerae bacterium]
MNGHHVNLGKLALVCWTYRGIGDRAYEQLLQRTGGNPDPGDAGHRQLIIDFLRKWYCFHRIEKDSDENISTQMYNWHQQHNGALPNVNTNLWELAPLQMNAIGDVFNDLSGQVAGARGGRNVSFGPVAAAKTLFAIRPNALVPWDTRIRQHYVHANGTYREFLGMMRDIALNLAKQCQNHGFEIAELPQQLGTPNKTVCKLIDEYNWRTITKKFTPPDRQTLERFIAWYE